mmetsp:Transcript_44370/g.139805  ORF Transcript_44370/g.139805 Transcript_44370/m.139805 type:complete len:203 (+) Transcript_44370:261-869(+)
MRPAYRQRRGRLARPTRIARWRRSWSASSTWWSGAAPCTQASSRRCGGPRKQDVGHEKPIRVRRHNGLHAYQAVVRSDPLGRGGSFARRIQLQARRALRGAALPGLVDDGRDGARRRVAPAHRAGRGEGRVRPPALRLLRPRPQLLQQREAQVRLGPNRATRSDGKGARKAVHVPHASRYRRVRGVFHLRAGPSRGAILGSV